MARRSATIGQPRVDYLFVYGSLRPALNHPLQAVMQRTARYIGPGVWPGRLYDLGSYPGAIAGGYPRGWVRGDLFHLRDATTLLRTLDRYEGVRPGAGVYRRVAAEIRGQSDRLTAWLYLYTGRVAGKRLIPSGDYLEYRARRSSPVPGRR